MEVIKTINMGMGAPRVSFCSNSLIVIEGESRPEDSRSFYDEILNDILNEYKTKLDVHIKLDYISSSSTICIINLLKKLRDSEDLDTKFIWFYDEIDEDMKELGEIISTHHKVPLLVIEN